MFKFKYCVWNMSMMTPCSNDMTNNKTSTPYTTQSSRSPHLVNMMMWYDLVFKWYNLNTIHNTVDQISRFADNTLHLGCAHVLPFPPGPNQLESESDFHMGQSSQKMKVISTWVNPGRKWKWFANWFTGSIQVESESDLSIGSPECVSFSVLEIHIAKLITDLRSHPCLSIFTNNYL